TVGAAEDPEPILIEERKLLERGVHDAHDVLVVDRAPAGAVAVARAANRASPLLGVAGAAARVREEDAVAGPRVHLHLVEETRAVLRERAAVDRDERRVALSLVEAGRAHEPRVDLGPIGGGCGEPLDIGELPSRNEVVADGGDPLSVAAE